MGKCMNPSRAASYLVRNGYEKIKHDLPGKKVLANGLKGTTVAYIIIDDLKRTFDAHVRLASSITIYRSENNRLTKKNLEAVMSSAQETIETYRKQ